MRLILVRHCEPDWPEDWTEEDVSLTERGRAQAKAVAAELGKRLAGRDGALALRSSPARRARETADIIAAELGEVIELEEAFIETALMGASNREMREKVGKGLIDERLLEQIQTVGEQAWARASELAEVLPAARIVAVSHDITIAAMVCRVLAMPLSGMRRFRVEMGSLTTIDFRGQRPPILSSLNETRHLKDAAPDIQP